MGITSEIKTPLEVVYWHRHLPSNNRCQCSFIQTKGVLIARLTITFLRIFIPASSNSLCAASVMIDVEIQVFQAWLESKKAKATNFSCMHCCVLNLDFRMVEIIDHRPKVIKRYQVRSSPPLILTGFSTNRCRAMKRGTSRIFNWMGLKLKRVCLSGKLCDPIQNTANCTGAFSPSKTYLHTIWVIICI